MESAATHHMACLQGVSRGDCCAADAPAEGVCVARAEEEAPSLCGLSRSSLLMEVAPLCDLKIIGE